MHPPRARLVPLVLVAGAAIVPAAPAHADVRVPSVGTDVQWYGHVKVTLDKDFRKDLQRSRVSIRGRDGATFRRKSKTMVWVVRGTVPFSDDMTYPTKGSISLSRRGGGSLAIDDLGLRIGSKRLGLPASLGDRSDQDLGELIAGPGADIRPTRNGYIAEKVPLRVTADLARAARAAKIKGIEEGDPLGVMNARVQANWADVALPLPAPPKLELPADVTPPDPGDVPPEVREILDGVGLGDALPGA